MAMTKEQQAFLKTMTDTDTPVRLMHEVFMKYDEDGSNSIDIEELGHLIYDLGLFLSKEEVKQVSAKMDRSHDRKIQLDEFIKWWTQEGKFRDVRQAHLSRMVKASEYFKAFDKNRNGFIDVSEFRKLYDDLVSKKLTDVPLETLFRNLDKDHNGKIDFNEFIEFARCGYQLPKH
eukprot:TRINITY_DN4420_c0_g1_i1.p1 TRINITY_DN4420_c0_g1~~TRINITY_DN4420_c0_g1_i1.p1  ORF type:complete len:188 (-),score=70.80 TRINITY_DN4420_c0_g1_i1:100-624(-)